MRPLPRYVLAIMAGFVVFELWIPLLAIILRALAGPTIPTAVQAVVPLFGLAVPTVVALGLSDYLADRRGLVRPYQPKRRNAESDHDLADEEEDLADEDEEAWEDEDNDGQERPSGDDGSEDERRESEAGETEDTARERLARDGGDEWRESELRGDAEEWRESELGRDEDTTAGVRRPSGGKRPEGGPG